MYIELIKHPKQSCYHIPFIPCLCAGEWTSNKINGSFYYLDRVGAVLIFLCWPLSAD